MVSGLSGHRILVARAEWPGGGGAAAGVVVLGKQFSSRTVAIASGTFCAILPRTTWAGIEARPYALSMMAAVWLTVLLVHAARRDTRRLWLGYGVALALSIVLDAYIALLLGRTSSSSSSSTAAEPCWRASPLPRPWRWVRCCRSC
ncbi:putative mannosyltransferase domain protein [Mycobacterium intracellulare]|nr:putative mannosyltransferase domain protein [Mycobacterium intracellulare]